MSVPPILGRPRTLFKQSLGFVGEYSTRIHYLNSVRGPQREFTTLDVSESTVKRIDDAGEGGKLDLEIRCLLTLYEELVGSLCDLALCTPRSPTPAPA